MSLLTYIGIDPGQSGGIAALRPSFDTVVALKMPATERDVLEAISQFDQIGDNSAVACIEQVHSMPGQGVSSTFKFGVGYGGLRMALTAAGIAFETVTPRKWQAAFSIPTRRLNEPKSQFKQRLKGTAQRLFPKVAVTLATCDALLIAEYCRRKHTGTL